MMVYLLMMMMIGLARVGAIGIFKCACLAGVWFRKCGGL